MPDALRLVLGTLTVLRVPAPRSVDRAVAGGAMLLAPGAGLLLGAAAAAVAWGTERLGGSHLLAAALAVASLAALTRALHLDGLADTADGLGSGRPAAGALEIMKRSDIGPFGVVTLLLVLLVDVTAAAALEPLDLVVAALAGRAVLPVACRSGVPSARPGGLGDAVAGSVRVPAAAVALVLSATAAGALTLDWSGPLALAAAVLLAEVLLRRCVRRLEGITGDVLGALVETATATCLVVLALSA